MKWRREGEGGGRRRGRREKKKKTTVICVQVLSWNNHAGRGRRLCVRPSFRCSTFNGNISDLNQTIIAMELGRELCHLEQFQSSSRAVPEQFQSSSSAVPTILTSWLELFQSQPITCSGGAPLWFQCSSSAVPVQFQNLVICKWFELIVVIWPGE